MSKLEETTEVISFEKRCAKGEFLGHVGGMRALAIALVVLFHLNGKVWPHGYLGVDVFLVISGFLLFRSAVFRKEADGWRDVGRFAWKRVQRIVPGMAILIIATVLVGCLFLVPEDELFLCQEANKALRGVVNKFLINEFSNYFASDSAFNPLLHLWYLAVALQVYLMWAVGKPLLQRAPRRIALVALGCLGGASLACNWVGEVSYYATLPRVWEVLAGGAVLLLPTAPRRWQASALAGLGLLCLLLPVASGLAPEMVKPAAASLSLMAVVSTVAVIRYAGESHLNALLSSKPLQWLGRISFSVYLVHMPLIVYGKMWVYGKAGAWYMAGIVLVAVLVGWAFWWAVEKRRFPWWAVAMLWGGAMLLCRAGYKSEGFKELILNVESPEMPVYENYSICQDGDLLTGAWDTKLNYYEWTTTAMCAKTPWPQINIPLLSLGDTSKKATILHMGDSYCPCCYPGLNEAFLDLGLSGATLASVVVPLQDYRIVLDHGNYWFDESKAQSLIRWLETKPQIKYLLFTVRWRMHMMRYKWTVSELEAHLRSFVTRLSATGRQVVLLAPTPEYDHGVSIRHARVAWLRGESFKANPTCSAEQYQTQHREVLSMLRRLESDGLCKVIEPLEALQGGEEFHYVRKGVLMMHDNNHLTSEGSIWLWKRLKPQLREIFGGTEQ